VERQVKVERETQQKAADEVDDDMAAREDLVKAVETAKTAKAESLPSPVRPEKQPESVADKPVDKTQAETVDPRWRRYRDAVEALDSSRHPVRGQKKGESDVRAVRG